MSAPLTSEEIKEVLKQAGWLKHKKMTPEQVVAEAKKHNRVNIDPTIIPCLRKFYNPSAGEFIYVFMPVGETARGLELGRINKQALNAMGVSLEISFFRELFRKKLTYKGLMDNYVQTYN